ncbi:hypothetical protein [Thalassolituus sp.]|uniref:hypothetical protein n=1 Tax=Thalassolituus sp. TaxID=2030822 RepID=UPI00351238F3
MSNDKVKSLAEKRSERQTETIQGAIKRAKQLIRNNNAENLEEPEGLASGDMKRLLRALTNMKRMINMRDANNSPYYHRPCSLCAVSRRF